MLELQGGTRSWGELEDKQIVGPPPETRIQWILGRSIFPPHQLPAATGAALLGSCLELHCCTAALTGGGGEGCAVNASLVVALPVLVLKAVRMNKEGIS